MRRHLSRPVEDEDRDHGISTFNDLEGTGGHLTRQEPAPRRQLGGTLTCVTAPQASRGAVRGLAHPHELSGPVGSPSRAGWSLPSAWHRL